MSRCRSFRVNALGAIIGAALLAPLAVAATKTVDLDRVAANGEESKCELNVIQTFPVQIENKVTNRAIGDAFSFVWRSAGPGGFTGSLPPGSAAGVGLIWTWTTNQSVFSYTGGNCENDICFAQTGGPDPSPKSCGATCALDGAVLTVGKGENPGQVSLTWSGGQAPSTIYRSTDRVAVVQPSNVIGTTSLQQFPDAPPAGIVYYVVRSADCVTRKSCAADGECLEVAGDVCVSNGPFGVPGRSLLATNVTVSSASLTSSLITFFSPNKPIFEVTSSAAPGGFQETLVNKSANPVTANTAAYPPGCCPANPDVPHQLNCSGVCVDWTTDPNNCGACGNVCGEGTCCVNGNCASLCGEGEAWCNGQCYDVTNDSDNCGACGNVCGENTCCQGGVCVPFVCEGEREMCADGLCYDTQNDPGNCGACGNVCAFDSICTTGVCVPCNGQAGEKISCDNRCVNLNTNPYNCGACGHSCNEGCPSGFTGVCSNGQSCRCVAGTPAPPPPSNIPPPIPPVCPNLTPPAPPHAGACPDPGPPPPAVADAPVCIFVDEQSTVPPGGSITTCRPGGNLFKEVPTQIDVCTEFNPYEPGTCAGGQDFARGTFMRLVPDTDRVVGAAFVTPYAVHVISDTSGDRLLQPGETASLIIEAINSGSSPIVGTSVRLTSPPVDLTADGVSNPVAVTISPEVASYGTIEPTSATADCSVPVYHPASGAVPYTVTLAANEAFDTSRPFFLEVEGTVDGAPWSMTVPIGVGIAHTCTVGTRDLDGVDGLLSPMGRLVPKGDVVPFASREFNAGNSRPMKLLQLCGTHVLTGSEIAPPEIVGLSEAVRGPIDISAIVFNDDTGTNDPFFRFNDSVKQWIFTMRTADLGTGRFTVTIRLAGRKDYVTGFVLK
jgi:hypothetical protein